MQLLNAINAVYTFYSVLFAATLIVLFIGLRMAYRAVQTANKERMQKAKFILLFAVVAMVCVLVVSFLITGKMPVV
jgi:predicted tellurium resistance membrane protein TerC